VFMLLCLLIVYEKGKFIGNWCLEEDPVMEIFVLLYM
jgi:hypothetical protein